MAPKRSSFLSAIRNLYGRDKRLSIGFVSSIAVHFLVMLIQFTLPERPPLHAPNLDVVLVNARHNTAPKDAQALAQANLDGGGDSSEDVRATSPLPPQQSLHDGNDLIDMTRGQQSAIRQLQPDQVLTQEGAAVAIKTENAEDKPAKPQPATGADAADARAMSLALEAEIAEKMRAYNQRPRRKQIGARTQEYRFAQYIEDWRTKAERIGEMNYPAAARGKIYDTLVMTVSIKKDGSIEKIIINRPSKHDVLNKAAERIVRLGDPYAPFPPAIAKDTDIIEITRTWAFTNDRLGVRNR
ncbi:MAG: TonB family protein [Azoarcus sp.]|jgi:protein TonB|nr:TonB family protein [Azoarcus sp.]